jgi:hypothetical protein
MDGVTYARSFLVARWLLSAVCVMMSLLVLALWVRGADWQDQLSRGTSTKRGVVISSGCGMMFLHYPPWDGDPNANLRWYLDSFEGESPLLPSGQTNRGFLISQGGIPQIAMPHWFLASLFAAFAAIVHIQRFTARALLVATTCVAVVFAIATMRK